MEFRLTPEEIKAIATQAYPFGEVTPITDCLEQVLAACQNVLDAQLAKLSDMKLEDLREEIAAELSSWCQARERNKHSESPLQEADLILSILYPWLTTQLEATRIEERKAIGERIIQCLGVGAAYVELTELGKSLRQGKGLEG